MEQRVQGDVARRDLMIRRELKGDPIKRMHINEGMPTESVMGRALIPFLGNHHDSVPLKCLCTNDAARGANRKNSEVCVQLHRNWCYEGGQTLQQRAERGCGVSMLGAVQNPPGHSPE